MSPAREWALWVSKSPMEYAPCDPGKPGGLTVWTGGAPPVDYPVGSVFVQLKGVRMLTPDCKVVVVHRSWREMFLREME